MPVLKPVDRRRRVVKLGHCMGDADIMEVKNTILGGMVAACRQATKERQMPRVTAVFDFDDSGKIIQIVLTPEPEEFDVELPIRIDTPMHHQDLGGGVVSMIPLSKAEIARM